MSASTAHALFKYRGRTIELSGQPDKDLRFEDNPGGVNVLSEIKTKLNALACLRTFLPNWADLAKIYNDASVSLAFENDEQLVNRVVDDIAFLYYQTLDTRSVPQFLAQQKRLIEYLKTNPAIYKERAVTVGFEHEFLQMESSSPLQGLVHVEFGKGEVAYYNGITFKLETDSDNAIELVSPPFVLPAKVGLPKPDDKAADKVNQSMGGALRDIARRGLHQNVGWLVHQVNAIGIDVQIYDVAKVNVSNVTHHVTKFPIPHQIDKATLLAIAVRPSSKGSSDWSPPPTVLWQMNFATDLATAASLMDIPPEKKIWPVPLGGKHTDNGSMNFIPADCYKGVLAGIRNQWQGRAEGNLGLFGKQLASTIVNLHAVPYLAIYNEYQKKIYVQNSGHGQAPTEAVAEAGRVGSSIKDWQMYWLKTSLYNVLAALDKKERAFVKEYAESVVADKRLKGLADILADEDKCDGPSVALTDVGNMFRRLADRLGHDYVPDELFLDPTGKRQIEINEHNPLYLGPRQDTYYGYKEIQMPAIWPNRPLFLIETRFR
jgi:hypothetical protein